MDKLGRLETVRHTVEGSIETIILEFSTESGRLFGGSFSVDRIFHEERRKEQFNRMFESAALGAHKNGDLDIDDATRFLKIALETV